MDAAKLGRSPISFYQQLCHARVSKVCALRDLVVVMLRLAGVWPGHRGWCRARQGIHLDRLVVGLGERE